MPYKAKRICRQAGCTELTNNTYCELHTKQINIERERYRATAYERGYDARWTRVRNAYISKHPLCERCKSRDAIVLATLVHHIVRIADGGARLDYNNLQSLCVKCHDIIHNEQGHKW